MAHVSVTLDRHGKLLSFSGDMAQGIEFETFLDRVTQIRIGGAVAVDITYFIDRITSVKPGPSSAMLHLSFGS